LSCCSKAVVSHRSLVENNGICSAHTQLLSTMSVRIVPTVVQPPELPPLPDSTGRRRRRLDPIGAEPDDSANQEAALLQDEESRRQRRREDAAAAASKPKPKKKVKVDDLDQYKPGPNDPSKKQIRKTFAKFDRDGSGAIDASELELMIQAFTPGLDSSAVGGLLNRFDADGSGELSVGEFGRMLQQLRPLAAAACGKALLKRQGAGVLIPGGKLLKPSDALEASADPGVRVGICAPLTACLIGAAPALACLCLFYYHDAGDAACSTDLGQWLLVQGGSGCVATAFQLMRLIFLPKRKYKLADAQAATEAYAQGKKVTFAGTPPKMLTKTYEKRAGQKGERKMTFVASADTTFFEEPPPTKLNGLFDLVMLVIAIFSLVWFVIGNVRLYATSACDAVPLDSSVVSDAGSGLIVNATGFAEDDCCDADLWHAVHGYFMYAYVVCGLLGLCCLAVCVVPMLLCCCVACVVCCADEETQSLPGLDEEEALVPPFQGWR